MGDISEEVVVGSIVFVFFTVYGVVEAIVSAKNVILTTLLSVLSGLSYESEIASAIAAVMIVSTIVVVFVSIPGRLGLFQMLIGR